MKIYFDAGIKQLTHFAGYRGEILTSLLNCSNFKNTHLYILEVWEALYLQMHEVFIESSNEHAEYSRELFSDIQED